VKSASRLGTLVESGAPFNKPAVEVITVLLISLVFLLPALLAFAIAAGTVMAIKVAEAVANLLEPSTATTESVAEAVGVNRGRSRPRSLGAGVYVTVTVQGWPGSKELWQLRVALNRLGSVPETLM
jgi:hypothetical protein